jgi:hypothetical protein
MHGRLTIARLDGPDGAAVNLQIEDTETDVRIVDVRLTCEDLAQALLGIAWRPCSVTVRLPLSPIQKQT